MSLVSVIIPTYNRAQFIVQTVESVLGQTYSPLEIIVVDNNSTDDTIERLQPYQKHIKLITEPQQGMGGAYARNAGIKQAHGEYIGFLDSDDLWYPQKIEKQMALFAQNPHIAWNYTDSELFDGYTGQVIYTQSKRHSLQEGDILRSLFVKNFIPSITPLIRRDVFQMVGVFFPLHKSTDWDMMLRIASLYPIQIVPEVLASFRQHSNNVTSETGGQKAIESIQIVIERAVTRNPELAPLKNQALANNYIANGLLLAKKGSRQQARRSFEQAIRLRPGYLSPYVYWLGALLPQSLIQKAAHWRRKAMQF
ncbi:MAG: glycosyltransferase [Ardenticatenaceae bacterium]|nr:glycosyltransferase [Ardenticatenaceae bacterium]